MKNLSPMMQQYLEMHEQVKDALLFFRLGDFYEMFFDDAITASKVLDLTLTGRDCGLNERAPMCGVPYHAVDTYIARLIDNGYKVAICEQVSDPKESKGLVDRRIVRIISSGTITESAVLKEDENNYLMCIYYDKLSYGITHIDVSTGEAYANYIKGDNADEKFLNYLASVMPSEILVNPILYQSSMLKLQAENVLKRSLTPYSTHHYNTDRCEAIIKKQFCVFMVSASGLSTDEPVVRSTGAALAYLNDTQKTSLNHINKLTMIQSDAYMHIDCATKNNLELTQTIRTAEKKGSLLWVLDNASTPAGSRKLRQWINEPLKDKNEIVRRHDVLSELTCNIMLTEDIGYYLKRICDMQRMSSKISYRNINGRDLLSLRDSAENLPKLKRLLINVNSDYLITLREEIDDLGDIWEFLTAAISDTCSANVHDGNLIKNGYSETIDEYRNLKNNAKKIMLELEIKEREKSGIKNLKVKYNKVFGYYIEVTKSNIDNVPDYFIRKQTLVNAERYYTEELKEIEIKLLSAQQNLEDTELALYNEIVDTLAEQIKRIQQTAGALSELDALCSLAIVSSKFRYVRPSLNDEGIISINDGRHPVVESIIKEHFIPNDTFLNLNSARMIILTGPNMAGKSTYIRQVAIIVLMNQIGCFVPCSQANLCVVDRIFTRVGASDDLASGQSTFMVEMSEVANILKNATRDSLVILDEVGRGTSTTDGLSIAQAVTEFLWDKNFIGCKTLFATHYHELTDLGKNEGIVNYSITTKQSVAGIIFLHKIKQGSSDRSYGIEVAKLAGLPGLVTARAEEILEKLEKEKSSNIKITPKIKLQSQLDSATYNLLNYSAVNLAEELKNLPLDEMTPIEVMNYIAKLKKDLNQSND